MAMILDFRSRPDARAEEQAGRSEPHGEREAAAGAQIIIFPGVRRERHEEPPKQQRRRKAPKRDRLELPD
jgi:hypothetical protein